MFLVYTRYNIWSLNIFAFPISFIAYSNRCSEISNHSHSRSEIVGMPFQYGSQFRVDRDLIYFFYFPVRPYLLEIELTAPKIKNKTLC